jgi:hypothetical protein
VVLIEEILQPTDQRQQIQPIALCAIRAIAIAPAELAQLIRQVVHPLALSRSSRLNRLRRATVWLVVLPSRLREIPQRDKGQVLDTPAA